MNKAAKTVAVGATVLMACVSGAQAQVVIDTVPVGNPGNAGELSGEGAGGLGPDRICGAVDYTYNIGKYEVTAGQYTEFLNAVAATDPYGLYNPYMWDDPWGDRGCKIDRTGSSGSYAYSVAGDWADRPVNYVSWVDAVRFANWLHNGQPTGAQDLTTTEDGSYYLDGAMVMVEVMPITREPDATWVIPSEDEWYKAAYHYNDGVTGNYWDYPTESDTAPTPEAPPGTDMTNGSANYYDGGFAIGSPYYRTEVGAYDAKPSDSPYGTFDQGGNVREWNEAIRLFYPQRGLRGGYFNSGDDTLHAADRHFANPLYERFLIGFRVAEVSGCTALAVRSLVFHGGPVSAELAIDMGVKDGIEPRIGQITKLEIDLDDAGSVSVTDTASVSCSAAWSGTATVTAVVGNTVTVEFSSSLPNEAYCVITLDCGAEVCVRMCEGDMNRDGDTNTTDGSAVKLRFGQALTDANCEWDFNHDGAINTTDASQVKLRFGFTAPDCP